MLASVSNLVILKVFMVGTEMDCSVEGAHTAYRSRGSTASTDCDSWVPVFLDRELQEYLASSG